MTQLPATKPQLPQSTALAEAEPTSLSELLSRDPEGFQQQDRLRVYQALRDQRARFEAAEAAGKGAKATKRPAKELLASKPEELGL